MSRLIILQDINPNGTGEIGRPVGIDGLDQTVDGLPPAVRDLPQGIPENALQRDARPVAGKNDGMLVHDFGVAVG